MAARVWSKLTIHRDSHLGAPPAIEWDAKLLPVLFSRRSTLPQGSVVDVSSCKWVDKLGSLFESLLASVQVPPPPLSI